MANQLGWWHKLVGEMYGDTLTALSFHSFVVDIILMIGNSQHVGEDLR